MKLLLRDYLAAMRERRELDALLPDMLSELGFTVFAWPQVGTSQFGVDVGAVSPANWSGGRRVYLFSIKRGDLTRQSWNNDTPQGLMPSLDEIILGYLPTRLPAEYAGLKVVICPCFGGIVQDSVSTLLAQYTRSRKTRKISFEIWDGSRLADTLLAGPLSEELLPKHLRKDLQKCVAFLDEPDVAYGSFSRLADALAKRAEASESERIRAARQLFLAVSMADVWGREMGNLEGPYRISELALLHLWELIKPLVDRDGPANRSLTRVLQEAINLHLRVARDLIDTRLRPLAGRRDALAAAVRTRDAVDINLALFETVGRISLTALWMHWLSQRPEAAADVDSRSQVEPLCDLALTLIESNAILDLPIADEQNIDVALVLFAALASNAHADRIATWLDRMVHRLDFAIRRRDLFPSTESDYRDLLRRREHRTDEDFQEATNASVLIPLVALWAEAMGHQAVHRRLASLVKAKLGHTTAQLWLTDDRSEASLYLNRDSHGRVIAGLPIGSPDRLLTRIVADACERYPEFRELSAFKTDFWPLILSACRHWRLPLPPHVFIRPMLEAVA